MVARLTREEREILEAFKVGTVVCAHTAAGLAWVVGPIYLTLFFTLL